jgi:hypothetical protein
MVLDANPEIEQAEGNRLDPARILRSLWDGRLTIIACTAISTLVTVLYLHTLDFSYSATMTLVPPPGQSQSSSSPLGGLAAMAGLNIGGGVQPGSAFSIYTDAVGTRDVADEMIRRNPGILKHLFSYAWDNESQSWKEQPSLRHAVAGIVKPVLGMNVNQWSAPSGADLQQYIAQSVKVVQDPKRPVITMTYFNPDPKFAGSFLGQINEAADMVLRRITLDRSSKYARYLEDKLRTEQGTDLRQVLVQVLSQQETQIMMSSSDTPYAAQPLGAPIVSLFPVQPRGNFILLAGVLIGVAVGAFAAIQNIALLDYLQRALAMLRRR